MHPVVFGVAGLQAAQHQAGGVVVRFVDFNHLEAPLKCGIALEVLLVFAPGGGGNGSEFPARQGGLEQVGRVRGARLITCPDDGVGLVDKQQHRQRRLLHRLNDVFQALLELALYARARLQQAEVEGAHRDRLQRVRDIAFTDTQRQAFHQCGFAYTRFAHQNRVVLAATGENIHHLADFIVAAKYRVDFTVAGAGGDVEGEFIQGILQRRAELSFFYIRIYRSAHKRHVITVAQRRFLLHFLPFVGLCVQQPTQALQLTLPGGGQRPQAVAANQRRLFHHRHQQMNAADLRFTRQRGMQPRVLHQRLQTVRELRTAAHRAREFIQKGQQILPYCIHIPLVAAGNHCDVPLALFQQFQQPVLGQNFRMCAGLAQGGGAFHRAGAVRVETT